MVELRGKQFPPQFLIQDTDLRWRILAPNPFIVVCNSQKPLHLLKARTTMDNIFLSHSYILVFPPKSLFSITLILICITVSRHIVRKSFLFPLHYIVLQEKCYLARHPVDLADAIRVQIRFFILLCPQSKR